MDALVALTSRRSFSKLSLPAPSVSELNQILDAAMHAPDHKELRPWHFTVVQGDAREELGNVAADALLQRLPNATQGQIEKERFKPTRAPVLIAVAAKRVDTNLRFSELVASACAATQNILIAVHALGYGAIWRSGDFIFEPAIKQWLGLNVDDELVGMIYIGTTQNEPPERASTADVSIDWRS